MSDKPELLIQGFLDAHQSYGHILLGRKFLILGSKGSGKSAIASHIKLSYQNSDNKFVKICLFGQFPFSKFSGILPKKEAPITRYQKSWEYVLLLALLNNFSKDKSCISNEAKDFQLLSRKMRNIGILPANDLSDIVEKITRKEININLFNLLSFTVSGKSKSNYNIHRAFDYLTKICYSVQTDNNHYIVIDGIDDILISRQIQLDSITALIQTVDRMNRKLSYNNISAKIIVLCRIDMFEKLRGPNANKIKQDSSIVLDWYQNVRNVYSTNLAKLINLRASISYGENIDFFSKYFSRQLSNGNSTVKTLLDNTRHTPRDLIQLLNYIKRETSGVEPTENDIYNGLRLYSIHYLIDEIKDELSGFVDDEVIKKMFNIFQSFGKSRFSYPELEKYVKKNMSYADINLVQTLQYFYNCGAIGHIKQTGNHHGVVFMRKYRNPYTEFDKYSTIDIHMGLMKAFNIPFGFQK